MIDVATRVPQGPLVLLCPSRWDSCAHVTCPLPSLIQTNSLVVINLLDNKLFAFDNRLIEHA